MIACPFQHGPLWIFLLKGKAMKFQKSTLLVLLLTFFLAAFAVALAQTSSQSTQKTQTEESCSMDSCCCKGDSCPMKEGTASADAKDGCCCCDGDSCEMKTGDMKNHAAHGGCGCCGADSSDPKKTEMKEKMKNHSTSDECCCDMKMKHKDAKHKVKDKAA